MIPLIVGAILGGTAVWLGRAEARGQVQDAAAALRRTAARGRHVVEQRLEGARPIVESGLRAVRPASTRTEAGAEAEERIYNGGRLLFAGLLAGAILGALAAWLLREGLERRLRAGADALRDRAVERLDAARRAAAEAGARIVDRLGGW